MGSMLALGALSMVASSRATQVGPLRPTNKQVQNHREDTDRGHSQILVKSYFGMVA